MLSSASISVSRINCAERIWCPGVRVPLKLEIFDVVSKPVCRLAWLSVDQTTVVLFQSASVPVALAWALKNKLSMAKCPLSSPGEVISKL